MGFGIEKERWVELDEEIVIPSDKSLLNRRRRDVILGNVCECVCGAIKHTLSCHYPHRTSIHLSLFLSLFLSLHPSTDQILLGFIYILTKNLGIGIELEC
jgi:hypothetical protein